MGTAMRRCLPPSMPKTLYVVISRVPGTALYFERSEFLIATSKKKKTEITKNGYTRSSNNHFRVQRKSSTRTPPGRPLIGRTTVVPGSGSKQSGCTRCAELMFRSTRYWLPLYPELVRSVQATRRRAHTPTRARVHTRISE